MTPGAPELLLIATTPLLARSVPLLGYSALSRGRRRVWRFSWLLALTSVYAAMTAISADFGKVLIDVGLANVWFLATAVLVNLYARLLRGAPRFEGTIDLFVTLALCLLVPLGLFPDDMHVLVAPMGWEFWLSSYSYVRYSRSARSFVLGDCLFFLMINPMLVFRGGPTRMQSGPAANVRGLARVFGGYCAISLGMLINGPLAESANRVAPWAYPMVFLAFQYATHSGRASQDIGILHLLGYRVPERYHYPFLAKSPQEFWQRWNIYVSDWARSYLFLPLAYTTRKWGLGRRESAVVALLLTFTTVGLMHQLVSLWQPQIRDWGFTVWFALNGLLLIGWRATAEIAGSCNARQFHAVLERVAFFAGVAAMSWAAIRLI